MKKVILIVIISLLIAVDLGLLIYGITLGEPVELVLPKTQALSKPGADIKDGYKVWTEISDAIANAQTNQDKAAAIMVYAVFNQINCSHFFYQSNVVCQTEKESTYSEIIRAQEIANSFYQAMTYTGLIDTGVRRIEYETQKLSQSTYSVNYNGDDNIFTATWPKPTSKKKETIERPWETYRMLWSWFFLPIYLGDWLEETYTSTIIDNNSVSITYPTANEDYYVLHFEVDKDRINGNTEDAIVTRQRLNEVVGNAVKNMDVKSLSFDVQIWRCGVFREIDIKAIVDGSIKGRTGEGEILKHYEFSYDRADSNVAKWIKLSGIAGALNATNKLKYEQDLGAINEDN